ncbi:MAG: outer membrane lipoprotein carrier protein LolA [Candidatus Paceibacterota bacterium]
MNNLLPLHPMKFKVLISLLTVWLLMTYAVNPPKVDKDKDANKLLKDVSKKYKAYKSLKAEFSMTNEPAEDKGKKTTEKGTLISKNNSFKLSFGGQEIFCNGKYIWTYTAETNECVKDNYNPNSSKGINPSKIFSIWEKGFLYVSEGSYKKGNANIAKIKLTPTDKSLPYFLMNLEVDQATKTLQSMKVSFKAGNKQTYSIINQIPNAMYDDNTFEFDASKHKGVEMIDLSGKKNK